jgi:hypothetical protein
MDTRSPDPDGAPEHAKMRTIEVRERMVGNLNQVDHDLAKRVAEGCGVAAPRAAAGENHGRTSPALSQYPLSARKCALGVFSGTQRRAPRPTGP